MIPVEIGRCRKYLIVNKKLIMTKLVMNRTRNSCTKKRNEESERKWKKKRKKVKARLARILAQMQHNVRYTGMM